MARATKVTKTTKPIGKGRKPDRPASVAAKTPTKATEPAVVSKRAVIAAPTSTGRKPRRLTAAAVPAKVTKLAATPKRVPVAAAPAPKLSKDELRVQLDKLERANATLQAKNREANRTAKADAARIAELEGSVARLEKTVAAQTSSTPEEKAAKPSRAKRQSRGAKGEHAVRTVGAV
jgi:hypothetical protein